MQTMCYPARNVLFCTKNVLFNTSTQYLVPKTCFPLLKIVIQRKIMGNMCYPLQKRAFLYWKFVT